MLPPVDQSPNFFVLLGEEFEFHDDFGVDVGEVLEMLPAELEVVLSPAVPAVQMVVLFVKGRDFSSSFFNLVVPYSQGVLSLP